MKKTYTRSLIFCISLLFATSLQSQTLMLDQSQPLHDYGFGVSNSYDHWQTFIPSLDNMYAADIYVMCVDPSGTFTIKVQNESGDTTYVEYTENVAVLPADDWYEFIILEGIILVPGKSYRLSLIRSDDHSPDNAIYWRGLIASTYPGYCNVNPNWETYDFAFQTYGLGPLSVSNNKAPDQTLQLLGQSYPNPFSSSVNIEYTIYETSQVSLVIYDLTGKDVRTLVSAYTLPGTYHATWDGSDLQGNLVNNGFYFYKLMLSNGRSHTKRLLLVR